MGYAHEPGPRLFLFAGELELDYAWWRCFSCLRALMYPGPVSAAGKVENVK